MAYEGFKLLKLSLLLDVFGQTNSIDPDQTIQNAASDQGQRSPTQQLFYTHSQIVKWIC